MMPSERRPAERRSTALLLLTDLSAFAIAFAVSQFLRLPDFHDSLSQWWSVEGHFRARASLIALALTLFSFAFSKQHYSQRKPFWDELRDILGVLFVVMLIDGALMFFNKWYFSRIAFGVDWVLIFALVPGLRLLLKLRLLRNGRWQLPLRLVGSGNNAREAWLALRSERLMGYELAEVLMPPGGEHPGWTQVGVRDWESGLQAMLAEPHYQVMIALEPDQQHAFDEVLRQVSKVCPHVVIVPPTRGLPLFGMEPLHAFSHEVLLLRARNNLLRPSARVLKRCFDVLVASLLLVLLAPLFAYLIFRVRQTGGPAFFGHQRITLNGESFPCYKFRTMVPNSAEVLERLLREDPQARAEWEAEFKLRNDPRITRIGDFLRRTSLDELPQLWNVLRGEMSLVGPRPVIQDELAKYAEDVSYYLQVRPGMTGLWQVSGRNDVDYETRVALDAWYVRNWSLWNDIIILLKTVKVVMGREGAY